LEQADGIPAAASRLDVDEAIDLAFGTAEPRPPRPSGLSKRETEIVRLEAEGLPAAIWPPSPELVFGHSHGEWLEC
jgi:hypothetical protein